MGREFSSMRTARFVGWEAMYDFRRTIYSRSLQHTAANSGYVDDSLFTMQKGSGEEVTRDGNSAMVDVG